MASAGTGRSEKRYLRAIFFVYLSIGYTDVEKNLPLSSLSGFRTGSERPPFLSVATIAAIYTGKENMKMKNANTEVLKAANDNPGGATTVVLFDVVTLMAQTYVAKARTKDEK